MADISIRLAAVLDELPIAIALVSPSGQFLGKAGGMSRILGDMIPSYDPNNINRWRFTDAAGAVIPPTDWPTPRALRGERIDTGMLATYRDTTCERRMKVISMPTQDPEGEIAAIYFLQVLDAPTRSANGSLHDLQQKLIDELAQAVVAGWRGFVPSRDRRLAS